MRYAVTPFQKLIKPPLDRTRGADKKKDVWAHRTDHPRYLLERRQLYCERAEVAIPRDRSRISDGVINQLHLSKFQRSL